MLELSVVGFGDFTTSALLMTDVFEALISSSPKAVKKLDHTGPRPKPMPGLFRSCVGRAVQSQNVDRGSSLQNRCA